LIRVLTDEGIDVLYDYVEKHLVNFVKLDNLNVEQIPKDKKLRHNHWILDKKEPKDIFTKLVRRT
jgi:hypothetical protein